MCVGIAGIGGAVVESLLGGFTEFKCLTLHYRADFQAILTLIITMVVLFNALFH